MLGKSDGSEQDRRIHLYFSGVPFVELLFFYLLRDFLVSDYLISILIFAVMLLAWLSGLGVCANGIRWGFSASRRQELSASLVIATGLSGLVFLAGCVALGSGRP
jgi:hypothetical protein